MGRNNARMLHENLEVKTPHNPSWGEITKDTIDWMAGEAAHNPSWGEITKMFLRATKWDKVLITPHGEK